MISNILVLALLFPQALPPASLQLNLLTLNLNSASSTAHHQSPNSIVKIGAFSNMRYDAEHAFGYTAQLWREQNRIFGFLLSSQGLMGDTPTGLLEDVRYEVILTGGLRPRRFSSFAVQSGRSNLCFYAAASN